MIRFNATDFVKATFMLSGNVEINIKSARVDFKGEKQSTTLTTLTLLDIRKRVLGKCPRISHSVRYLFPEIWMDGDFKVIEVEKKDPRPCEELAVSTTTSSPRTAFIERVNGDHRERYGGDRDSSDVVHGFVPFSADDCSCYMREWLRMECGWYKCSECTNQQW